MYKDKYLKYKNKYLKLKYLHDGSGIFENTNEQNEHNKIIKVISSEIKNQGTFGTCWAHSVARSVTRTLQVLGVIPNQLTGEVKENDIPYVEQFYLLFFSLLLENNNCDDGDIETNGFLRLFNWLKENKDDLGEKLKQIKKSENLCFGKNKCYIEDNEPILKNISEDILDDIIKKLKYLLNNELLFVAIENYSVYMGDKPNYPTKAIKTMLKYHLQPAISINISKYLIDHIKTDKVPEQKEKFIRKCEYDTTGHAVVLSGWTEDGIRIKNSWGNKGWNNGNIYSGNFIVPDLKYLVCDDLNTIPFVVLMFDYENLPEDMKKNVQNFNFGHILFNSTQIKQFTNNEETDIYGFLHGKRDISYLDKDGKKLFIKGEYAHGLFTGESNILKCRDLLYEGEWKDGVINGKGKIITLDGGIFEGEFVNNKIHGKGKKISKNGLIMEGNWIKNKMNGFGKVTFTDGTFYEGNLVNNVKEGFGREIYPNGKVYEGNWVNNKINGFGKLTFSDGQVYEGNFVNGLKEGFGREIYPNEKVYEGNWVNDKMNGNTKIIYADGIEYETIWIDDVLVRLKYNGEWIDYKSKN